MTDELEDRVVVAMRFGTANRLTCFKALLDAHKDHETFRTQDWVQTRELGFVCSCTGHEEEFRINIRSIREAYPEAREIAERFIRNYRHLKKRGGKAEKKRKRRAEMRAKALLCRHLTRQQRWTLRGAHYFDVTGSDGRRYRIFKSMSHNVVLLRDGVEPKMFDPLKPGDMTFCVIGDYQAVGGWLPIYDLMLAQKVMLETDAADFIETAIIHYVKSDDGERLHRERLDLAPDDLENPERWVREQLTAAVV